MWSPARICPDLIQWTKGSMFRGLRTIADFTIHVSRSSSGEVADRRGAGREGLLSQAGDPQSADKLIYERPDHPNWTIDPLVMEGSRYLLLYIYTGVPGKNMLAYQDLRPRIRRRLC